MSKELRESYSALAGRCSDCPTDCTDMPCMQTTIEHLKAVEKECDKRVPIRAAVVMTHEYNSLYRAVRELKPKANNDEVSAVLDAVMSIMGLEFASVPQERQLQKYE